VAEIDDVEGEETTPLTGSAEEIRLGYRRGRLAL